MPRPSSPFSHFITASRSNERHLDFTNLKSTWMLQEIRNTPANYDCRAFCAGSSTIAGPDLFCNTATYSISPLPSVTYTWTVGPNLSITTANPNTNQINVSQTSGFTGTSWVRVELNGNCGTIRFEKTMQIRGAFTTSDFSISGPTSVCPGQTAYYTLNPQYLEGVLEYQWLIPSGWTYLGGQGTKWLDLQAPYGGFGSTSIGLKLRNACGWMVVPATLYVQENYYGCSGSYTYAVSPNPADDYVAVKARKKDKESKDIDLEEADYEKLKNVEVKLYDKYGQLLQTHKFVNAQLTLNTRNLAADIYVIHVINGNEVTTEKIMVAH